MSFRHLQLVLDHSKTRGPDRTIMLVLAYRANEQGECWPGLNRIADDTGLTRRTITRCLPHLEAVGELTIQRKSKSVQGRGGLQAVNLYHLTIPEEQGRDPQSPPLSDKVGTHSPKGRDRQSSKVGTHSPKGRDPQSPEYSLNRNKEQTKNRKAFEQSFVSSSQYHERMTLNEV